MLTGEVDPWVFSWNGKRGGNGVFIVVHGGPHSAIFLKLLESWSKVGNDTIEMATVYFVTFFC